MAKFRLKSAVEAVQWFPDPEFGSFVEGTCGPRYEHRKLGYDKYGVEYTATEVGVQSLRGFTRIKPGDWIVLGKFDRYVYPRAAFEWMFEPDALVGSTYVQPFQMPAPAECVPFVGSTGSEAVDTMLADPKNPIKLRNMCCAHVPGHKCGCICGMS
jgi:hypothetical protein